MADPPPPTPVRSRGRAAASISLIGLGLCGAAMAQDTVVVRAEGPGAWGLTTLVPELRIGQLDGPPEYLFGRVGQVVAGRDGTIFVWDAQVPVIRRYGPDGAYLGDVGREGQGPGEYRRILGMQILKDGRLAVWDIGNQRISLYRPDGTYLEAVRALSGYHTNRSFAVDTAGDFYVKVVVAWPPEVMAARRRGERRIDIDAEPVTGFIRIDPEGTVRDTIRLPLEASQGPEFVLYTSDGPYRPFTVATLHAWSPLGYVVSGRNDRYTLTGRTPAGGPMRIERPGEPVPVRREEREQVEAWFRYFASLAPDRDPGDAGGIPRVKPAFRDLYVDDDGRIFVDRYVEAIERDDLPPPRGDRPALDWREPSTFDVFRPDGEFLGTLVLPPDTYFQFARGNELWGVERGAFDESYVVRYRISVERP